MEGNTIRQSTDTLHYAIRMTFGVVHAVILTLFSFVIALYFPSLSHILFALLGCVVAPCISLILTIFCNACVEYVSLSTMTVGRILKTAWIPPLGIFCASLIILPLEMMPSLGSTWPVTSIVATSIVVNFLLSAILQVYAVKDIQLSSNSGGISAPT